MKVLAIFPDLQDANPGGVQVSAQIAWDMLQRETSARALFFDGWLRLARAVRNVDFQPDVVLFWHLDLLRVAPLLRTNAKRVVFLHGIEAWRKQRWMSARTLSTASFIANSQYTVERASPFIPFSGTQTPVVPLGIGASLVVTAPAAQPPAAIMIGRLDAGERYKGHHEVVRAWPAVVREHPDAQLWIVGDGNLRAELEEEAEEVGVSGAIRFFGRVTDAEKDRLIGAARCLVLPSRGEGFGLVYLEAMRAGRPCVVGTDAGREVVAPPEAGVSVDPADSLALANAISELLTLDSTWEAKSEAARNRYAQRFTAGHFQARLLSALRDL